MPTITRKIELELCTEGLSDQERKDQWNVLYHINDNLYRAANNPLLLRCHPRLAVSTYLGLVTSRHCYKI
jgi:hypothetical protein